MPGVVRCTISGIDAGGFAWQNVFHMSHTDLTHTTLEVLTAAAALVQGNIITPYSDAANQDTKFLDIATKIVSPTPSYTHHQVITDVGSRAIDAAIGAVCPLVRFLPATGTILGGFYAVGAGVVDFVGDEIQNAYQVLLAALADAFLTADGSDPIFAWQLCTVNADASVATAMVDRAVPTRPTTLNKRIRA